MFEAQLLNSPGGSLVEVYSPWFPREGDLGRFTLEVVDIDNNHVNATMQLTVAAFTKNREDTGNGSNAIGATSIVRTTAGRSTSEWVSTSSTGFKELVRYKFTFQNAGEEGGGWVLFRMLPPAWFDAVTA